MSELSQNPDSANQAGGEPLFGETERQSAQRLIALALEEDLGDSIDLTTQALVAPNDVGKVTIVARKEGHLAGLPIVPLVFDQLAKMESESLGEGEKSADTEGPGTIQIELHRQDGEPVSRGDVVATLTGSVRALLTGERTVLNFLTHLSGVATLVGRFVEACRGTPARILDTRKTHPGWRILEKYAVRCGGGTNHRIGLFDGVLIKDNHLASWSTHHPSGEIAEAVRAARSFVASLSGLPASLPNGIEVEVDTLKQLEQVLAAEPEIVLLDNMSPDQMREAMALRDCFAPRTLLEASGGVNLDNVATIAATGIDRISIGALTHSAPAFDLAFDWGQS